MPPKETPPTIGTPVPTDLTISAQLAKIGEGAPATQLIRVLLQQIAADVSTFVRDVHSSSQVYLRARVVYDYIQGLIKKVDSSADIEWDAFDIYTAAIPILERILFDFYSQHQKASRDHLPPTSGVETAFIFIEAWDYDRKMLEKAFNDLANDHFLQMSAEVKTHLEASRVVPRNTDDINALRALNIFFQNNAKVLQERDIVQERGGRLLQETRKVITQIILKVSKSPPAPETSRISIMTLMIAYIPFALLVDDAVEAEWKDYLRSAVVWDAVQKLLVNVSKHLDGIPQAPTLNDLEKEWETFKDILLRLSTTAIDTKVEILDLLRLAARIRRPLHGRSVELIRMLYYLDGYSQKDQKAGRHRRNFKLVLGDTISSLEAAEKAVSDVRQIAIGDDVYKNQHQELQNVLKKVEETFSTFGIADQWSTKETAYNNAVNVDESHLNLLKKRIAVVSASA
ncbi:hypothetical protein JR316_0008167 [Psilocybe cubensis]|uniref:Uncharacterized protein n=2 Tax=Psilocybe cubensis TaxID=181762 RepID=A0A8H7XTJ2_PSICU|nr:hypothetical protein JR316_0008167 [Psilocybe cubensis]KAH9479572.1 hypothetical protein JR316_0008167 [Psilocybe cubensis]